jgi:hypothetical protein
VKKKKKVKVKVKAKKKKKQQEDWVERAMKSLKRDENNLRSKDVAHLLDCCPDDVIDLARKGKLEAYKRGRLWVFRLKDVVKYKKQADKEEEEYLKRIEEERYGRGRSRVYF